jgi:hypothetical protein
VLTVIAIGLAALCSGAWAAEGNLLSNPSFERLDPKNGCPADWRPYAPDNAAVYSLAAARTGVACAALTDGSPTGSQGLRSAPADIVPGRTYEASVWVYIERLEAGGFSLYLEYWVGDTRVADFSTGTGEVGKWVELRLAKPAPPGAKAATVLIYGSSVTVGRGLFDDASLTEAGQ